MDLIFLAYDFSDAFLGNCIRAVKMARHLSEYGWTPHVITASPVAEHPALSGGGSVTFIPSPERSFGGGIAVRADEDRSVTGKNPAWLRALSVMKKALPVERQMLWWTAFRREALKVAEGKNIRAVLTTASPYAVLMMGDWLARRLGVPHVVDLRDDWWGTALYHRRPWLNRRLLDASCSFAVRRASAVTVPSPRSLPLYDRFPTPACLVRNGFDEEDFADVPLDAATVPEDGPLRLLHVGWLYESRSIISVLEAVREANARAGASLVEVEQIGMMDRSEWAEIEARGLTDVLRVLPQQPHREAVATMIRADVLLAIPTPNTPTAIPGKLYEYLRARRPILLWSDDCASNDVAADTGLRWRVAQGDHETLVRTLLELLALKKQGRLRTHTDPASIPRYARHASAGAMADVLNTVTGERREESRERRERTHALYAQLP